MMSMRSLQPFSHDRQSSPHHARHHISFHSVVPLPAAQKAVLVHITMRPLATLPQALIYKLPSDESQD